MDGLAMATGAALLGLATTSSSMLGAALGLYARLPKRLMACILAFAAGTLISALAIELGFQGTEALRQAGYSSGAAWALVATGFSCGAVIYYTVSLFLDEKGAAIRLPTRFRDYALGRKREEQKDIIDLLSKSPWLRHLPPEDIEGILRSVSRERYLKGDVVFLHDDPGDALFIVEQGRVEVVAPPASGAAISAPRRIAELGPGQAFGEMALLTGHARTATVCALEDTDVLKITKEDFERLIASDQHAARAIEHLSHERAIRNLREEGADAATWADVASSSLEHLSQRESQKILAQAAPGAGLAIVFGNILDTIPGCLVIGSQFDGFAAMSVTLILGMFLGGVPEAAASGHMLTRAGFKPATIFGLWSIVLAAGLVAAAVGYLYVGSSTPFARVFLEGVAGGAVLGMVAHAMIPEAIHDGRSLVVLPIVGGFLFALYFTVTTAGVALG
jgi:CRP-like cAMP-binding protein